MKKILTIASKQQKNYQMNNNIEPVELEEEEIEHFKFEVPKGQPLRIDKYLWD
jgi:hypothetical protein